MRKVVTGNLEELEVLLIKLGFYKLPRELRNSYAASMHKLSLEFEEKQGMYLDELDAATVYAKLVTDYALDLQGELEDMHQQHG